MSYIAGTSSDIVNSSAHAIVFRLVLCLLRFVFSYGVLFSDFLISLESYSDIQKNIENLSGINNNKINKIYINLLFMKILFNLLL